jgi:hypothetical protein
MTKSWSGCFNFNTKKKQKSDLKVELRNLLVSRKHNFLTMIRYERELYWWPPDLPDLTLTDYLIIYVQGHYK